MSRGDAAPAGGGLAEVLAVPKMPGPAFRLLWNGTSYTVTKPDIGATDVYTAAQVRAFGRECLRSHGEAPAELIEAATELRQRQRDYLADPKDQRQESKGRLVGIAADRLDAALAKVASNGDTK